MLAKVPIVMKGSVQHLLEKAADEPTFDNIATLACRLHLGPIAMVIDEPKIFEDIRNPRQLAEIFSQHRGKISEFYENLMK